MKALASEPKSPPVNPPLKSMIDEFGAIELYLKPKPPSLVIMFLTEPLRTVPTVAKAPTGLADCGFKPPTIVTGSPS